MGERLHGAHSDGVPLLLAPCIATGQVHVSIFQSHIHGFRSSTKLGAFTIAPLHRTHACMHAWQFLPDLFGQCCGRTLQPSDTLGDAKYPYFVHDAICLFTRRSRLALSWTIMIWFQISVVLCTGGIILQLDSPQCCTPNLKRRVPHCTIRFQNPALWKAGHVSIICLQSH